MPKVAGPPPARRPEALLVQPGTLAPDYSGGYEGCPGEPDNVTVAAVAMRKQQRRASSPLYNAIAGSGGGRRALSPLNPSPASRKPRAANRTHSARPHHICSMSAAARSSAAFSVATASLGL